MRLNRKKVRTIMEKGAVTEELICSRTGLDKSSVEWILENGFASVEAIERIAGAVGVEPGIITSPDPYGSEENVIEFTRDGARATVTFSQGRYKSRIKKLAEEHPEECRVVAENRDGSLCAHIPVEWIRIYPSREISEAQREAARRNLLKVRPAGHESSQISTEMDSV